MFALASQQERHKRYVLSQDENEEGGNEVSNPKSTSLVPEGRSAQVRSERAF